MKRLLLLSFICLLNLRLIAAEPLIQVDVPRIKQVSINAITTKYPELKSTDLTFCSLLYAVGDESSEGLITVTYSSKPNAPANTNDVAVGGSPGWAATRANGFNVALSITGKVIRVSKSEITTTRRQK